MSGLSAPDPKIEDGDLSLLVLPLGDCGVSNALCLQEYVRLVATSNDVLAVSNGNMEKPVSVINFWRLFHEYSRVNKSPHSVHSPLPQLPEQGETKSTKVNARKLLTQVRFGFLPTVSFERQNTVSVALSNAVVNPTHPANFNPANENWSPLGAA